MTRAAELRKRSVSSADRLEASFRSCGHVVFSPQLRGAICSYVDAMKAEGVLVERVIVGMKRIASRGCLRTNGYAYREQTSIFENDVEMQRAVSLCVARYHVVSGVAS
jgi:hypothetical protein